MNAWKTIPNEDSYPEDIENGPIPFHALVVTGYFFIILCLNS